jgi:hypothetical protein
MKILTSFGYYYRYKARYERKEPCAKCGGKVVAFGEYDDNDLGRVRMLHCQRCGSSAPQMIPKVERTR